METVRHQGLEIIVFNLHNPTSLLLGVCNNIHCLLSGILNDHFPGLTKGFLHVNFTARKFFFNFFFSGIEPLTHRHPGMIYG